MLTCSKWNTNNLALESKHFKDKDMDTRERFLKEFGDSSIFGEKKVHTYDPIVNNDFKGCIKNENQWKGVKDYKDVKPRGQKPMGPVRNDSNFMKTTESSKASIISAKPKK